MMSLNQSVCLLTLLIIINNLQERSSRKVMKESIFNKVITGVITAIILSVLVLFWNWASEGGIIKALNGVTVDYLADHESTKSAVITSQIIPKGAIVAFSGDRCPEGPDWELYLPGQGKFLRGIDPTGTIDPSGIRKPGNTQNDSLQGHMHTIKSVTSTDHGPADKSPHGFQSGPYKIPQSETQGIIDDSRYGIANVSTETRPKNVAVWFCIKT